MMRKCLRQKNGFALVIALALMTFILLLVMSLATLLQVESHSGNQALKMEMARQNAMLGARMALAELAYTAGPDQRVTARADILNRGAVHPHWTGVWNGSPNPSGTTAFDRGEEPRWLLSKRPSTQLDPMDKLDSNYAIELVGIGSVNTSSQVLSGEAENKGEPVVAERVDIINNSNSLVGSYAWWVGDEGVKANVKVNEPGHFRDLIAGNLEYLDRLAMVHRVGWTPLFGADDAGPDNDPDFRLQQRVVHYAQVGFLNESYSEVDRLSYYHDLTPYSYSVLTNIANGGLKLDLTRILDNSFSSDSEFADHQPLFDASNYLPGVGSDYPTPRWGLLRSFYNLASEVSTTVGAGVTVRAQEDQEHGVFPLIGMVQFNYIGRASVTANNPEALEEEGEYPLEILFKPYVTLVNPYNVRLEAAPYTVRVNLILNVPNNSRIRIGLNPNSYDQNNPDYVTSRTHELFNWNSDGTYVELAIPAVAFLPGQSLVFSLDGSIYPAPANGDSLQMAEGLNLIPYVSRIDTHSGAVFTHEQKKNNSIAVQYSVSNAAMSLYTGNQLLQDVQHIYLGSSDTQAHALDNPDGLSAGTDDTFIRMKMRTSKQNTLTRTGPGTKSVARDLVSSARWLAQSNIRAPLNQPEPEYRWGDVSAGYGGNHTYDSWYQSELQGVEIVEPWRWGEELDFGNETHVVLFNFPRQYPLSIAALQHANIAAAGYLPAYAIGNSWASPFFLPNEEDISYLLNAHLYDRFFFSTVDAERTVLPDWVLDPLRNSRLVLAPKAEMDLLKIYDQASANLLVKGGFNINSTSVQAWRAILRGLQGLEVEYWDPFSNLSDVDDDLAVPYPRTSVPGGDANQRWRGFRRLTEEDVQDLAEAIVLQVRERGPFMSLAQFVNRDLIAPAGSDGNLKGALQAAIDATNINDDMSVLQSTLTEEAGAGRLGYYRYREAAVGPRSTAAPGFLTQADILQLLDPVLAARSDTFVIRAYGDVRSPVNDSVEASAVCELVVQRLPEFVNPNEDSANVWPPTGQVNRDFGRRFTVVSFRWLNNEDI